MKSTTTISLGGAPTDSASTRWFGVVPEVAVRVRPDQHSTLADRVGLIPGTRLDAKAVDTARRTFDRANALLRYAASKGVAMPPGGIPTTWPLMEITERNFWSQMGPHR